jgi:hypothetical protein
VASAAAADAAEVKPGEVGADAGARTPGTARPVEPAVVAARAAVVRLRPAVMGAAALAVVRAQTARLVREARQRYRLEREAAEATRESTLAAAIALARRLQRRVDARRRVAEAGAEALASIEADNVAVLGQIARAAAEARQLSQRVAAAARERDAGSGLFGEAASLLRQSKLAAEAARARNAVDRRVALSRHLEHAVDVVRKAGEAELAAVKTQNARAAEAVMLEHRRKCDSAAELLRGALEAELAPLKEKAETGAVTVAESKEAAMAQLAGAERELQQLSAHNAALALAVQDARELSTALTVVDDANGVPQTPVSPPVAGASPQDAREAVLALACEYMDDADAVVDLLDEIEGWAEAEAFGAVSRRRQRQRPKPLRVNDSSGGSRRSSRSSRLSDSQQGEEYDDDDDYDFHRPRFGGVDGQPMLGRLHPAAYIALMSLYEAEAETLASKPSKHLYVPPPRSHGGATGGVSESSGAVYPPVGGTHTTFGPRSGSSPPASVHLRGDPKPDELDRLAAALGADFAADDLQAYADGNLAMPDLEAIAAALGTLDDASEDAISVASRPDTEATGTSSVTGSKVISNPMRAAMTASLRGLKAKNKHRAQAQAAASERPHPSVPAAATSSAPAQRGHAQSRHQVTAAARSPNLRHGPGSPSQFDLVYAPVNQPPHQPHHHHHDPALDDALRNRIFAKRAGTGGTPRQQSGSTPASLRQG